MRLFDGMVGKTYLVNKLETEETVTTRLESLGAVDGTEITVLNKKKTAIIIKMRGTRFALGKGIAENIIVDKKAMEVKADE